ncbi:MAG: thiamine phosphate synthase, partial [Rhodospirillaceae bacterium]|nr:thiamine phosphate synthase [Rhodospirillaceae bacterium]
MSRRLPDLSVYLVTDPQACRRRGVAETVRLAVVGGVTCVQVRDKQASDTALVDIARSAKAALAGSGVPLIVNDRLAVAQAVAADGLHLGQGDGDPAAARAALGPRAILGLSIDHPGQLAAVDPRVVDYVGA